MTTEAARLADCLCDMAARLSSTTHPDWQTLINAADIIRSAPPQNSAEAERPCIFRSGCRTPDICSTQDHCMGSPRPSGDEARRLINEVEAQMEVDGFITYSTGEKVLAALRASQAGQDSGGHDQNSAEQVSVGKLGRDDECGPAAGAVPSEQVIADMANCLMKHRNLITREEVIAAYHIALAASPAPSAPAPGAVFTAEQVRRLDEYQRAGAMHPFTCPNRGDGRHFDNGMDKGGLIPTVRGWICQCCDHTQDWAHDFMLDGSAVKNGQRLHAMLAASPLPPEGRSGWKLVPIEPTFDMQEAGGQTMFVDVKGKDRRLIARKGYRAMLAAAPDAGKGESEGGCG